MSSIRWKTQKTGHGHASFTGAFWLKSTETEDECGIQQGFHTPPAVTGLCG